MKYCATKTEKKSAPPKKSEIYLLFFGGALFLFVLQAQFVICFGGANFTFFRWRSALVAQGSALPRSNFLSVEILVFK